MRKHPLLQMLVIGVVATAILIPIALIIPWFPTDASKQASSVHTLYDVLLIATVPIFVLVETVVLYSVWKFRMKPGEELKDGPPIHGNTRLEVVWTAVPAVLLIAMCTYAYVTLRHNEASQKGEMTINVTERQFAFEFSYPINGSNANQIVSPNLYLAKGQPVVFKIRSLDVIHSFFVPEFSEKIDAVPGITTTLRVTPTRVGTYPVECTELCGPGHSLMRTAAYVVSPAHFQAWLRSQKPNGPPPVGEPPPNAAQPGVPGAASSAPAPSTSTTSSSPSASSSTAEGKAVFTIGRLLLVPHARRGGRHRDDRTGPRCPPADRLRQRGVQTHPWGHSRGVHPHRDHQTLRVHSDGLPRRSHAGDVRPDAVVSPNTSACQLPVERGKVSRYRANHG